ncbi:DUF5994 family protein [Pseudonocardia sp. H11422]|uniref:DUF5994 family protein n=1 Tax=Pseudonocardia sp. H11422 TaxID=2835866 RepID=UPI0020298B3E|nr:DUF5994 family protein [Pseudonocardia sp. H11422]
MKPKAPISGYGDGAWPRSRDLSTELPALHAGLAVRLGRPSVWSRLRGPTRFAAVGPMEEPHDVG